MDRITKAELRRAVMNSGSHFFDCKTMKFFEDTMENFGIRATVIDTWTETGLDCWELYRKRPVKHGLTDSAYFNKKTLEQEYKKIVY